MTELSKTVHWEADQVKGARTTDAALLKASIRAKNGPRQRWTRGLGREGDLLPERCSKRLSLYVFPADSTVLEQANWQDMSPLLTTPNKFERTGGTYPLTALRIDKAPTPPVLRTSFSLQPFLIDDQSYIGLTDTRRAWMVIAKYRGGEQFEDLCYLRAGKF